MKAWITVSAAEKKESDGPRRAMFFRQKGQFWWFVSGNASSSHYTSVAYSENVNVNADILQVHVHHFYHLTLACEQADMIPYHEKQIVAETKENIISYAGSKSKDKV